MVLYYSIKEHWIGVENLELDIKNELLIGSLKSHKYEFGLKCIPFIYLEKYTGMKFLKKLKRYLIKLIKWEDAFGYKLNRYQTQEARIRGERMKSIDTQFNEDLYDITITVDYVRELVQQLREEPSYKEYIEELEFEEVFD